ncbi:kinase-like protein [Panus rudis PR-1116 ss-1]|nr:kinase-like protein [Panus rudis PR-1116 ss-1]
MLCDCHCDCDQPGRLSYRKLRKQIGRGNFGQLFASEWIYPDGKRVPVAVKVIPRQGRMDEEQDDVVRREIEIHRMLLHKRTNHIIEFLGAHGDIHGSKQFYLVFERAYGGDLGTRIRQKQKRRRTFAIQDAAQVIRQICIGLAYLHSYGIVHRDIKPDNILYLDKRSPDGGHVVIADLGQAAVNPPHVPYLYSAGDVRYRSPEMIRQLPYTVRTDCFSLAVIAYELLTGEHPFLGGPGSGGGPPFEETMINIYQCTPDYTHPVWSAMPNGPLALEFVSRTLVLDDPMLGSHDPRRRPSAAQLLEMPWMRVAASAKMPVGHDMAAVLRPKPMNVW